ncbi:type 2 lanthipeptide synthetase LanM family protein [Plantactinospora sp. CA-290183]|uniref:type 2 lanthipeptide synthetase LanM family protein n=1 Tax=Plantactinospora sp. CA-290183 TaxID=3240006 RepID=UPI003D8D85B8
MAVDALDPAWFLACGLRDRQRAGRPVADDTARGRTRLAMWREEPAFAPGRQPWEDYLSRLGLDAAELEHLLAESPASVRDRHGVVPDYLPALERAFREVPLAGLHLPGADQAQGAFAVLAAPLIHEAVRRLRTRVDRAVGNHPSPHIDAALLTRAACAPPLGQIVQLVSRTAVLELNILRMRNGLSGESPQERFADFVRRLGDPDQALALLREYPVLARDLVRRLDDWVEVRAEFVERLVADVAALVARLADPAGLGPVTELVFGAGDTHRGGRSVALVGFARGDRVVYKPRSLRVDARFQRLLDWLNVRGDHPRLRTLWILERPDYGWMEYAVARPCADRAELSRFYRRQGAYLALLQMLNATDFHLENVIAAGEDPVLVDLEALFNPWQHDVAPVEGVPEAAIRAMRQSVLGVGLLPNPTVWTEDGGGISDLSGLSGAGGQLSPTAVALWRDAGTDAMSVGRGRVELSGAENLPSLRGEPVDALEFRSELVDGYRRTYQVLARHRDELLAAGGPLDAFAGAEIRVIIRPTRNYLAMMLESYHPDLLRDALDRERFYSNLWAAHRDLPGREELIAAEARQVERGDVPYFSTTVDGVHVRTGDGLTVPDVLPRAGLELVTERIRALDEADLARQLWFVEGSLAALELGVAEYAAPAAPATAGPPAPAATADDFLAAASRIGDRLLEIAVTEGDEICWFGLTMLQERVWKLLPAGLDLFNGLPGIALFLGRLAEATGEARYRRAAERAAGVVAGQVGALGRADVAGPEGGQLGVLGDLGGIVYALSHLGAIWRRTDLLDAAGRLVPVMDAPREPATATDVTSGAAGGILALLSLAAVAPDSGALEAADRLAGRLVRRAIPAGGGLGWPTLGDELPLAGFSHGAAGIAVALARLDRATASVRHRETVRAALRFENTLFDPALGNWRDERPFVPAEENMVAWCHGAGGVGLARADLLDYLPEAGTRRDLATAVDAVRRTGITGHSGAGLGNHSSCHGDLGNVETLLVAACRTGDAGLFARARRAGSSVLADLTSSGVRCGVPKGLETPGLFPGLAGVGYGLLRLAAPERIPSLLLFEDPHGGEKSIPCADH